jgi:YidC/Oxa1 family membrane protein insertase
MAALFVGPMLINSIWPPPKKPKPEVKVETLKLDPKTEPLLIALGGLAGPTEAFAALSKVEAKNIQAPKAEVPKVPETPAELIEVGGGDSPYHLQVLFNTQGAGVQRLILSRFQHAGREGLGTVDANGKSVSLHLIPGVRIPREKDVRDQKIVPIPELKAGKIDEGLTLLDPAYLLHLYETEFEDKPTDLLSKRVWKVARNEPFPDGQGHVIAFETEVGAPFFTKITKTFSLGKKDYHLGFQVSFEPLKNANSKADTKFRYQVSGPIGMPIEGEWYTTTYRQGIVGWLDKKGTASRNLEYPQDVRFNGGSDKHDGTTDKPIVYAGTALQFFGAVMAVDLRKDSTSANQPISYVRFTPDGPTFKTKASDKSFLDDMTFRTISEPLAMDVAASHSYVLYHGPVKVRLLKQLKGDDAVAEETVDFYRNTLHLDLLTDAPMPNWFGRRANSIYWTDLVVFFTDVIHWLLGILSSFIPWLGVCVVIITLIVRGLLFPMSRRQTLNAKTMQEKMAKLSPELKKLKEKYGNDYQRFQQEQMKLYREHDVNPAAALGGCLPLLLQMPIFMGLYYALQESIFFRLHSFAWMPNLAAPDMLFTWSEKIPFISVPDDIGSMFYLGPFFNLLPLIAVGLMMYTQAKMMPVSDDPQVEMQRKMMKFMMIFMAIMFYKVAAGLCIYFICSSIWGIFERRLLKNVKLETKTPSKDKPTKPKGWLGRKMQKYRDQLEKIMEEAQKQQQLQKDQPQKKKKK